MEEVFAPYVGTDVPGCAAAVSEDRSVVLADAWGMADLEHDAINTPETRFEAGSVSKQVTAAAAVLLALEGKISLGDDVRDYFPELPDYEEPVTIRHLLNHTSGLRDWGSVAFIHGWPRTTRVHTHAHALHIAARQRSLNYPPGTYYSYTNTGYNLLAMLVERVTGTSFADFTRERLFEPLGMTRTEWRDDFTRVVEDRATAYQPESDGFHLDMPFENVHGNGGLLTTVGDLLRWTWNLETGRVGGPRFLEEMHRRGVLTSGRTIDYASGLFIGDYGGVPEVQHGGATAGYRAFLSRFPEQGLAVAVLCNRADANPGGLAHRVADVFLGEAVGDGEEPPDDGVDVSPSALGAVAGTYRSTRTGEALSLTMDDGRLMLADRAPLTSLSEAAFRLGSTRIEVLRGEAPADGRAPLRVVSAGDTVRWEPVPEFHPGPAELEEYTGAYHSAEAEVTYEVVVEDGALALRDRYGETRPLEPSYPDAFTGGGRTFRFLRDDEGRITGMSWGESRVWDLRFEKVR